MCPQEKKRKKKRKERKRKQKQQKEEKMNAFFLGSIKILFLSSLSLARTELCMCCYEFKEITNTEKKLKTREHFLDFERERECVGCVVVCGGGESGRKADTDPYGSYFLY